jgi:hypothetical protein
MTSKEAKRTMAHCNAYALAVAIQELVYSGTHDVGEVRTSAARKMFADAVARFF